jgi:uncharacterized protein (TIGR02145 family)
MISSHSQSGTYGEILNITFNSNPTTGVKFLALGTTKVFALKVTIIAKYTNNKGKERQVSFDFFVQDCFYGCTVDRTNGSPITFMCYNLGVHESTKSLSPTQQANTFSNAYADGVSTAPDSTVYGALYQWGRIADGHQKRISSSSIGPASGANLVNDQAAGTFVGNFIQTTSTPHDWRTPKNDYLWDLNQVGTSSASPSKSVYDPCPIGWRVPTYYELNGIRTINTRESVAAAPYKTAGILITPSGVSEPTLFLPAGGYRRFDTGMFHSIGTHGYYWSSSVPGNNNAYDCYFENMNPRLGSAERGKAYNSRCVLDE